MITKYRNKGFVQLACAFVMSGLLVWLFLRRDKPNSGENYFVLLFFLFLGCWTLWMIASYNLAKAKGYGGEIAGGLFLFLLLLGFCFPIAAFLFPAVVLFGLKDRTKGRRW